MEDTIFNELSGFANKHYLMNEFFKYTVQSESDLPDYMNLTEEERLGFETVNINANIATTRPYGAVRWVEDTGDVWRCFKVSGSATSTSDPIIIDWERILKHPRWIGSFRQRQFRQNNILDQDKLNIYSTEVDGTLIGNHVNLSATTTNPFASLPIVTFFTEDTAAGDGGSPLAGTIDMIANDNLSTIAGFNIPVSGFSTGDRAFVAVKADNNPTQVIDNTMSAEDQGYTVWNVIRENSNNADVTGAILSVFGSTISNAPVPQITIDIVRGQYVHLALFVEKQSTSGTTRFGGTNTGTSTLRSISIELRTQPGRIY